MIQQNPNVAVWKTADDYCKAATAIEHTHFQQAQVLASLAIEILLKSFLAERTAPWTAQTKHGHSYRELYSQIDQRDKDELKAKIQENHSEIDLDIMLDENDGLFINSRYLYEESCMTVVPGNTVYFARVLSECVSKIAKDRKC